MRMNLPGLRGGVNITLTLTLALSLQGRGSMIFHPTPQATGNSKLS